MPDLSSQSLYAQKGAFVVKLILILSFILIASGLSIFLASYWGKFGLVAPTVELVDVPRGIGIAPVSLVLKISSAQAGLARVRMALSQHGREKELVDKMLAGQQQEILTLEFPGPASDLEEGMASFSIMVQDRSLIGRTTTKNFNLRVDYQRPKVEIVAAPQKIEAGGAQLIFFRAIDESLAIAGVKIGDSYYTAFPARAIDPELQQEGLMVLFFTVPMASKQGKWAARVVAEDSVGNTNSVTFNLQVLDRIRSTSTFEISNAYLRRVAGVLFENNRQALEAFIVSLGKELRFEYRQGSEQRLIEQFVLVNQHLRQISDNQVSKSLIDKGFERVWTGYFQRPLGRLQGSFAEEVLYRYGKENVDKIIRQGSQFYLSAELNQVKALNAGVVVFADSIGIYGNTVAIAHGLGIVSVYGFLESMAVRNGEFVQAGQSIGRVGLSGLGSGQELYLEMRLNGQPIDPEQWWNQNWYAANVVRPINNIRRQLGLAVKAQID